MKAMKIKDDDNCSASKRVKVSSDVKESSCTFPGCKGTHLDWCSSTCVLCEKPCCILNDEETVAQCCIEKAQVPHSFHLKEDLLLDPTYQYVGKADPDLESFVCFRCLREALRVKVEEHFNKSVIKEKQAESTHKFDGNDCNYCGRLPSLRLRCSKCESVTCSDHAFAYCMDHNSFGGCQCPKKENLICLVCIKAGYQKFATDSKNN